MKIEIEIPEGFEIEKYYIRRIGTNLPRHKISPQSNGHLEEPTKEDFWSKIDWDKSNREIMAETRKSYPAVISARKTLGHPPLRTFALSHIDWKNLDWSKGDNQLSAENKCTVGAVKGIRARLGLPNGSPNGEKSNRIVSKEMIESVNWESLRDIDLAKQWHVSRERVRQIRQQNGFPVCNRNSFRPMSREFEEWIIANKDGIEGKIASEVADLCPITISHLEKLKIMRKSSIPFLFRQKRKSIALSLPINWELPNSILENVWNKCHNWAASNRLKHNFPEAKFLHHGLIVKGEPVNYSKLEGFDDALNVELAKASKIGITPRNMAKLKSNPQKP